MICIYVQLFEITTKHFEMCIWEEAMRLISSRINIVNYLIIFLIYDLKLINSFDYKIYIFRNEIKLHFSYFFFYSGNTVTYDLISEAQKWDKTTNVVNML